MFRTVCAIDLNDWIAKKTNQFKGTSLETAFRAFDTDGNGSISVAEVTQDMTASGVKDAPQLAAMLMKHADVNGDGKITYDEFIL